MMMDFTNPPPGQPNPYNTADPFAQGAVAAPPPPQVDPYANQAAQPQPPGPPEYVDTNDQKGGFEPIPAGVYLFKLSAIEGGLNSKKDQMVTMHVEVVSGPETGRDVRKFYTTTPKQNPKTHRWNSRGVADAREDLKRLGQPVPEKFPVDARAAAQIIGRGFQAAGHFTGMVSYRSYVPDKNDIDPATKQPRTKEMSDLRIIGPGQVSAVPAGPGGSNPFNL